MIDADRKFLEKQISILIERWGYNEVYHTVRAAKPDHSSLSIDRYLSKKNKRPTKKKISALDYVDRRKFLGEAKQLLSTIAIRFQNKEFLPSVGDVRRFLDMQGQDAALIKQREGSFDKILDTLYKMPHEKLRLIIDDNLYSGPSRLGPLSNEIKMASDRLRNSQRVSYEENKQPDSDVNSERRDSSEKQ